jgi:rSAM/selenodomain-associated transferase 1
MWRWRLAYRLGADPARLAAEYGTARRRPPVVLQIFAKNPAPGQVKTRLATAIGADRAAALYADLVEMTLETAVAARAGGIVDRVEVGGAPPSDAPAFAAWRARYDVTLETQTGADLGARMRNALATAVDQGSRAILVGTDCPVLDVDYLVQAAAALDDHDAVFGPVEDGGYALVGLARGVDCFSGVPWSAPDTMAATRARLDAQRVRWRELPLLWDVDEPSDLRRWEELGARSTRLPVAPGASPA